MAVGDVISDSDNLAAGGGSVSFTPAANTAYLITQLTTGATYVDAYYLITVNTVSSYILNAQASVDAGSLPSNYGLLSCKVFIDSNTALVRTNGSSGTTKTMGYTGIQIK